MGSVSTVRTLRPECGQKALRVPEGRLPCPPTLPAAVGGAHPPCGHTHHQSPVAEPPLATLIPPFGIVPLQWFSNLNVHPNYTDGLLKHRCWASLPPGGSGSAGLERGQGFVRLTSSG